jgi:hypothetical protein
MPAIVRQKIGSTRLKVLCLGLPLILVFSLAAAGAFAFAPCQGPCCCCQTDLQAQSRHAAPAHAKLPDKSGCCETSQPAPLHLQSCRTIDPPLAIPSIQPHDPEMTMLVDCIEGDASQMSLDLRRGWSSPSPPPKARSAPIYLLKQSFLC